jgi:poly [ADP-ribose] polymerase 10/14/15
MGFTDQNRNALLLEEEAWDINKVVDRLTLDSPATPDPGREGRVGGGSSSQDQSVPSSKGVQILGIHLDIRRSFIDSSHVLGKGSFADVFSGTYRFSGQQVEKGVAIKTFRGAQNLTPSMRKKIEEEVVVWTRLSHPNLVRLYGILTDSSHGPCLVLELCVVSLRSLLNQADEGHMKIPWNIRGKWLMEVACGMTELHSLSPQIIHRDLKAANVLLSSNDLASAVAKVTDFGVAVTLETVRSSSSAGGGGAGTLQWMAPETFKGRYSQKTDVYSFAVLAFEVVTDKVPHEGLSLPEINKRAMSFFEFNKELLDFGVDEAKQRAMWNQQNPLLTRRPDLVGQVQSGCPSFLRCLIEKCWSDNPDERPEFRQILDSLGKLQEGRPHWGDGGNGVRVVLPDGGEKTSIIQVFQNTLGAVQTKVTKVERVQNPKLWAPFAGMRQTMLERQGNSDSYERRLFHGTAEDSVDKIVADGFNRTFGFKEVNPNAMTIYGKGVYFAVNSKYSVDYTSPNSSGERRMFLCRVLVGEYCLGREDQPTPDVRRGTELYDSTVNNLEDPTIFVTYHDSQSYPEYIVTFTKQ